MPAVISHCILAERVKEGLEDIRPQLKINRNAFLWGASGPDPFFCHRLMPWCRQRSLSRYGSLIHNDPAYKILNFLADYARFNNDDIAMSYALGFVTHYAFDSIAHPFVLYFSDKMAYKNKGKHQSVCHNEIEAALDSLFLRYEKNVKISGIKLQKAAPMDKKVNRSIAAVLCKYLRTAYKVNVNASELMVVQRDWHNSLALLNDKTYIKRTAVIQVEKAIGLKPMLSPMFREDHPRLMPDYANLSHSLWFSQTEQKEHNESFFELADIAEEFSIKLIACIVSGRRLTADQCSATFSGH